MRQLKPFAGIAGFFLLGLLAIMIIPRIEKSMAPGSVTPGFLSFFGVGLVIVLMSGALVWIGIDEKLRSVPGLLMLTFAAQALVVVVKFALGPYSYYVANLQRPFELWWDPNSSLASVLLATLVFGLYATLFWIVWLLSRRGLAVPAIAGRKVVIGTPAWVGVALVITFFLLGGGALVLLLASPGIQYMVVIFAGPLGLMMAAALIGAASCASIVTRRTAHRAVLARDPTLVASFLWVGLAIIALDHALWFVYLLVLFSLWPLKVVIPK